MLLLGLCAILQMALLPGLLAIEMARLRLGLLRRLIVAFLLSGLLNYVLVQLLLLLGLYVRPVLFGIVIAEVLLLVVLIRRHGPAQEQISGLVARASAFSLSDLPGLRSETRLAVRASILLLLLSSLGLLGFAGFEAVNRFGDVFGIGDAVNSWNRWALEMATNRQPSHTGWYPQLVPSNYSIAYVLTGTQAVWIFSKAWISLFFPVLLLSLFETYRGQRRWEFLLGLVLTFFLFYLIMSPRFVYGGVVDIALATYAINAVHSLWEAGSLCGTARRRAVILGAAFAAACAVTKQGGLYVLLVLPLLIGRLPAEPPRPDRSISDLADSRRLLAAAVVLAGLIALPWYAWEFREIQSGRQPSNLAGLTFSLHQGRGVPARLDHAFGLLQGRVGRLPLVLLTMGALASCATPAYRWVTGLVTLPYLLLWGVGFSYDHRNAALALPFLATSCAFGIGAMSRFGAARLEQLPATVLRRTVAGIVLAVAAGGIFAGSRIYSASALRALQARNATGRIGNGHLNVFLVDYFRDHPAPGKILTSYKSMKWLPFLEPRLYRRLLSRGATAPLVHEELKNADVQFVLLNRNKTSPSLARYVQAALDGGSLQKVLRSGPHTLYIKRGEPRDELLTSLQDPLQDARSSRR